MLLYWPRGGGGGQSAGLETVDGALGYKLQQRMG
jgi:hypothetical protein